MKGTYIVISTLFFVFLAFLYPTLQNVAYNATIAGNFTGGEATLIDSLPWIFLIVVGILPIYFAVSGKSGE